jgi:hypothetical protein
MLRIALTSNSAFVIGGVATGSIIAAIANAVQIQVCVLFLYPSFSVYHFVVCRDQGRVEVVTDRDGFEVVYYMIVYTFPFNCDRSRC